MSGDSVSADPDAVGKLFTVLRDALLTTNTNLNTLATNVNHLSEFHRPRERNFRLKLPAFSGQGDYKGWFRQVSLIFAWIPVNLHKYKSGWVSSLAASSAA
jgi:hypothetical protein